MKGCDRKGVPVAKGFLCASLPLSVRLGKYARMSWTRPIPFRTFTGISPLVTTRRLLRYIIITFARVTMEGERSSNWLFTKRTSSKAIHRPSWLTRWM